LTWPCGSSADGTHTCYSLSLTYSELIHDPLPNETVNVIYVPKDLVGRAVAYFKVLSNQQTEDTQETEVIRSPKEIMNVNGSIQKVLKKIDMA